MDLEIPDIEIICLEIISQHTKPFFVCILYRPPGTSKHLCKNYTNVFNKFLQKLGRENRETIIIGDININYLDDDNNKDMKELLTLNGFKQKVSEPTRVTDTTKTLIDVILTTKTENLTDIKVIPTALSDHDTVSCRRKLNNKKPPHETIRCRDYTKYNPIDLQNDIKNVSFESVYSETNPNNAWKNLKSILTEKFNQHAPLISKRVKGKKSNWLNRELKAEMNYRDTLQRKFRKTKTARDFENFKKQRNKVNIPARKAKSDFNKILLNEFANDPNRFWTTLKRIFPTKEITPIVKTLIIGGKITNNIKLIASSFCSFFTNIATELKSKATPLKDFIWRKPKQSYPKTYSTFRFKEVRVNEVFKQLKKLSRKKATGPDELPPGMLKDVAKQISQPLCYVINQSLTSGTIPNDFKYGVVTPVFKSGTKQDMNNYRPITVLPVCSKLLKKCIHRQLSEFLEEKKLLSSTQFGFRKRRNTELAATLFMDNIREKMDKGEMTGAIFIDLSKAFDSLGHAHIIESLSNYGVVGSERELFINYLFGRKQSVRIRNEISPPEPVICGVPQGSILGPLLFLITFDDVGSVLKHSQILTYADDTVIYVSGTSTNRIQEMLQHDFNSLVEWLESIDLITNMKKGKTECMLFGTSLKVKKEILEIRHRENIVSYATLYKYLGIELDQTLLLHKHINSVYKKASGRLNLLKRLRLHLTVQAAMTIYQTMLLPVFTYCSIITAVYNNTIETKIANFEHRAYTIIYKGRKPPKICSIRKIQKKRLCLQVFNCKIGNTCSNFDNYFEIMNNKTRNKNCMLRLPKIKLESTKRSFRFIGAKTFNELPLEIRKATSTNYFINIYNKYL